jgi:hypothetical protein
MALVSGCPQIKVMKLCRVEYLTDESVTAVGSACPICIVFENNGRMQSRRGRRMSPIR